jgi:hypothetical protein
MSISCPAPVIFSSSYSSISSYVPPFVSDENLIVCFFSELVQYPTIPDAETQSYPDNEFSSIIVGRIAEECQACDLN